MFKLVLIGIGGAAGAVLRYVVSGLDYRFSYGVLPVSTLVINLSGSLVIGLLWGLFEVYPVSSHARMFIFIGLLGGFTTFSTFGLESFNLLRDGERGIALANILVTNILGIAFVFIGFAASRLLLNMVK